MTRGTTICCSAIALIALAKAPEPTPLVPIRGVWTLALNNQLTVPPAYSQSHAFFFIEHDRLVAYDIASGRQEWLVEARSLFSPAVADDLIFTVEAETMSALSTRDGSTAWSAPIPESLAVRPTYDNGWLIAVTNSGLVLAFRGVDGHLVWQRDLSSPANASPTLAADRVYVPTADGRVVALLVSDGSPVWERKVGGRPNQILALDDRLYAGSTDDFFYCLMTKDGRIDWRWRTGADVIGAPVADRQRVYFVSLDNVLRSLSRVSGGQQWMRALPIRPTSGPALAGSTIVVVGQSPTVRTFAVKDGAPATDINAGAEVAAPPHVFYQPGTSVPMILVVTRDLVKGAVATLSVHSNEPAVTPMAPLPNPVMPALTQPARP